MMITVIEDGISTNLVARVMSLNHGYYRVRRTKLDHTRLFQSGEYDNDAADE